MSQKPEKNRLIHLGTLLSFGSMLIGGVIGSNLLFAIACIVTGVIFVVFNSEVATERYRINQATENKFLKEYLFSRETLERDKMVCLIAGLGFLAGGLLTLMTL